MIHLRVLDLSAQAQQKKDLSGQIVGKLVVIQEHILKLILMRNSSYVDHWSKEIAGMIDSVPKLAHSKKYPSKQMLYKLMYENELDRIHRESYIRTRLKKLKDSYADLKITKSVEEIMSDLDEVYQAYCEWLCTELSSNGDADAVEGASLLKTLTEKYR